MLVCLGQKYYLCTHMNKIEKISFGYEGKEYSVANIPDVITGTNRNILIGPHSLNIVLYDDDKGYADDNAMRIDEQIYAYLEDEYFSLSYVDFLERVKELLD